MTRFAVALALLLSILIASPGQAAPASDAESILILYPFRNAYWWDHTNLTVSVRVPRQGDPAIVGEIHRAIAVWDGVLRQEFHGLITLTDVSGTNVKSDIILNYVERAGGLAFAGQAVCGPKGCNNIMVSSQFAQYAPSSPRGMHFVTLHELGHALGLGHAQPLLETTDLMGYGWLYKQVPPVLSACDVKGVAAVFDWALKGVPPHPPTVSSVTC